MPAESSRQKFAISGKHPDGRQVFEEFLATRQEAEIRKRKLEKDGFAVEMKDVNGRADG